MHKKVIKIEISIIETNSDNVNPFLQKGLELQATKEIQTTIRNNALILKKGYLKIMHDLQLELVSNLKDAKIPFHTYTKFDTDLGKQMPNVFIKEKASNLYDEIKFHITFSEKSNIILMLKPKYSIVKNVRQYLGDYKLYYTIESNSSQMVFGNEDCWKSFTTKEDIDTVILNLL